MNVCMKISSQSIQHKSGGLNGNVGLSVRQKKPNFDNLAIPGVMMPAWLKRLMYLLV